MSKSSDNDDIFELYVEMTSGDVLGDVVGHGGDLGNSDWYAPGDNRNPYYLGVRSRWEEYKPKKKKKKKSKKKKEDS